MNQVILVTGASRGIGKSIAESLAKEGNTVIGTSRSNFKYNNNNLISMKLDITVRDDIDKFFLKLKEENLLPNVLINNAGITSDKLFMRMTNDDWDNVLSTNLTGVFNITKACIKNMIRNRNGRIINISSILLSTISEMYFNILSLTLDIIYIFFSSNSDFESISSNIVS